MTPPSEPFFKPGKVSTRDKAAATDHTAKGIIEAEMRARDRKTERLKQLRLEKESGNPATPRAPAKSGKRSSSER